MFPQRLILPIDQCQLTASWQTDAYHEWTGGRAEHFGIDLISTAKVPDTQNIDRTVHSMGDGIVLAVGKDALFGNVIVIHHPLVRRGKTTHEIIARYCHMSSIKVLALQEVTVKTILGSYGHVVNSTMKPHLHLEIDEDISHPLATPSVKKSNFFHNRLKGIKMQYMCNPLDWIRRGPTQDYSVMESIFIRDEDRQLRR